MRVLYVYYKLFRTVRFSLIVIPAAEQGESLTL